MHTRVWALQGQLTVTGSSRPTFKNKSPVRPPLVHPALTPHVLQVVVQVALEARFPPHPPDHPEASGFLLGERRFRPARARLLFRAGRFRVKGAPP